MSDPAPSIPAVGIVNLRDAGGHRTSDGREVVRGMLFRSGQLHSDDSAQVLADLGIETVFDLRSRDEVQAAPDLVPDGTVIVSLDVLADSEQRIATHLADLFEDPTLVESVMRSGVVEEHYRATYRHLVTLDSARASYASMFGTLAELDHPALFHCTAGKDRTGWAAVALLTLLGVDSDTVTSDYLSSTRPVIESFRVVFERFEEAGGDPEVLIPVFAVTESYLSAAQETVRDEFGGIEGWFREGLGLDDSTLSALRSRLLA